MNDAPRTARIIEQRLDWLTCTARAGARAEELVAFGLVALEADAGQGDQVKPFAFQGYQGQGHKHLSVGDRSDGAIIVCRGAEADTLAPYLANLADHWSRVDVCVTAIADDPTYNPAQEYWELGQRDDPNDPALPKISQARTRWGGTTTYVGSRVSPVFARTYDKAAESKGRYPAASWRWELELKQFASETEQTRWQLDPNRSAMSRPLVAEQFRKWGLGVPFDSGDRCELWRSPKRERSVDSKERWLRDQVRGSAQLVAKIYGRERVIEALGLSGFN